MKLKLDMSCHLLNAYTKFQIDISKHVEKKSGKLGRTDGRTDGQTDGHCHSIIRPFFKRAYNNKANLRDLIAATGLVISNWIQIVNFSAHVTVKFDGWPCKTIGHLFYATSSFVHHFVPIGEFKLKLQSGNAQSGWNWTIFRAVRPWNLTDDLAIQ